MWLFQVSKPFGLFRECSAGGWAWLGPPSLLLTATACPPPGSHQQGIPLPPAWPGASQLPLWTLGWKLRDAAPRRTWVALEQSREQSGQCPNTGAQRVYRCPLVLRLINRFPGNADPTHPSPAPHPILECSCLVLHLRLWHPAPQGMVKSQGCRVFGQHSQPQGGIVGVSWVEPGVGLDDLCGSLPAWEIP